MCYIFIDFLTLKYHLFKLMVFYFSNSHNKLHLLKVTIFFFYTFLARFITKKSSGYKNTIIHIKSLMARLDGGGKEGEWRRVE